MKILKNLKKAFTLIETIVVIAVIAVLAGVSVGIYFGVTSADPEEEAVTIREQVMDLWKSHINDGSEYSPRLETKAHEFCTGFVNKKGLEVELNYRLLEFEDFVSTIPVEGEINRAYDPSGNSKEAVLIKVDTEYPTYFISTGASVIYESEIFELQELLHEDLATNPFVEASGLLNKYNLSAASTINDFKPFFELSDINVGGEIKKGVKYIRYNVYDDDQKLRYIVFGRANRSLNDDCKGKYTPTYVSFGDKDNTFFTKNFKLFENKVDNQGNPQRYNFDPNFIYGTDSSDYDVNLSKELNVKVGLGDDIIDREVELTISSGNAEYLVDSKSISYKAFYNNGGAEGNDSSTKGDSTPDLDIYNPIEKDEPGTDDDLITDDNIPVDDYPIAISYGGAEVQYDALSKWFQQVFVGQFHFARNFKYLYFTSFEALNSFLKSQLYDEIIKILGDQWDRNVYIFLSDGVVINENMTLKPNSYLVVCSKRFEYNPERIEYMETFGDNIVNLEDNYDDYGNPYILSMMNVKKYEEKFSSNPVPNINNKDEYATYVKNYLGVHDPYRGYTVEQLKNGVAGSYDSVISNLSAHFSVNNLTHVKWPTDAAGNPTPAATVTIKNDVNLIVSDGSRLFVEGEVSGTTYDYESIPLGYEVYSFGQIINNGRIQIQKGGHSRVTGKIVKGAAAPSGQGIITVKNGGIITEPLKITDYYGYTNTNKTYIERNLFPFESYHLDSIECETIFEYGSIYTGLICINEDHGEKYTLFGHVFLVAKEPNSGSTIPLFCMKNGNGTTDSAKMSKSYDRATNRSNFNILDGVVRVGSTEFLTEESNAGKIVELFIKGAFPVFNTVNTGFKLANINLNIKNGAQFNLEYTGSEDQHGQTELEVLATSKITVESGGTLSLGKGCFVFLHDYPGVSGKIEDMVNRINQSSNCKSVHTPLVWKLAVQNNAYAASSDKILLQNNGTILINEEVFSNKDGKATKTGNKTKVCGVGGCARKEVNYYEYKYEYVKSAVFSYTLTSANRILRFEGNNVECNREEVIYAWHSCTLVWEPDRQYPITKKYTWQFNKVAFGHGGDADPCWNYPTYQLYF